MFSCTTGVACDPHFTSDMLHVVEETDVHWGFTISEACTFWLITHQLLLQIQRHPLLTLTGDVSSVSVSPNKHTPTSTHVCNGTKRMRTLSRKHALEFPVRQLLRKECAQAHTSIQQPVRYHSSNGLSESFGTDVDFYEPLTLVRAIFEKSKFTLMVIVSAHLLLEVSGSDHIPMVEQFGERKDSAELPKNMRIELEAVTVKNHRHQCAETLSGSDTRICTWSFGSSPLFCISLCIYTLSHGGQSFVIKRDLRLLTE